MALRSALVDSVCEQRDQFPLYIAIVCVMAVLLAFSLLHLEPGTAAYAIAMFDLILIGGALALFGGSYWFCTKRAVDG